MKHHHARRYTKELLFWLSDLQRNRSWKGGRTVAACLFESAPAKRVLSPRGT